MNKQPDKFFRDKLHGYHPEVSADAWRRVAGNLREKNNGLWLKIAAGLLLLAAAGILIFPIEKDLPSPLASEKNGSNQKEKSVSEEKIPPDENQPEQEKIEAPPSSVAELAVRGAEKGRKQGRTERPSTATKKVVEDATTTQSPRIDVAEVTEEKNPFIEADAAAVETAEQKNVTIVFTAQEVDEKYLNKKTDVAEATSEVKESSAWRKVLDKAYDLKHNQDPIGNLRQKKNEILALNFKNDRQSHEKQ